MNPNNVNNKALSLYEFKDLLKKSVYSDENAKKLLSLFIEISNNDGILTTDDINEYDKENPKLKNDFALFLQFISNTYSKYKNKLTNSLAKALEKENQGNNIDNISNDKNITKIRFKTAQGGYKIVEYDNTTGQKNKEFEYDKNENVLQYIEYKNNQPVKIIKNENDKQIIQIYKNGELSNHKEIDKKNNEKININYKNDNNYEKTIYKNGIKTEFIIVNEKNYNRTVYNEQGVIQYVEKRSNNNIETIKYYDGKNLDEISAIVEEITNRINPENKIFKNKELYEEIFNTLTQAQLEAFYGKEELDDLLKKYKPEEIYEHKPIITSNLNNNFGIENIPQYNEKFENKTSSDITYVISTQNNTARRAHTNATFNTNWVQSDRHNSKTLDEFLDNLKKDGLEFDAITAKKLVKNVRNTSYTNGYCAAHIYDTLSKTSVQNIDDPTKTSRLNITRQNSAFQAAEELSNSKYFKEIPRDIIMNMDLNDLPEGCVIVFDANYRTDGSNKHKYGHIAIGVNSYNKSDNTLYTIGATGPWAIDNVMNGEASQKTHVRVFIPVKKATS